MKCTLGNRDLDGELKSSIAKEFCTQRMMEIMPQQESVVNSRRVTTVVSIGWNRTRSGVEG